LAAQTTLEMTTKPKERRKEKGNDLSQRRRRGDAEEQRKGGIRGRISSARRARYEGELMMSWSMVLDGTEVIGFLSRRTLAGEFGIRCLVRQTKTPAGRQRYKKWCYKKGCYEKRYYRNW